MFEMLQKTIKEKQERQENEIKTGERKFFKCSEKNGLNYVSLFKSDKFYSIEFTVPFRKRKIYLKKEFINKFFKNSKFNNIKKLWEVKFDEEDFSENNLKNFVKEIEFKEQIKISYITYKI